DGIRDKLVTGVQTCALPIFLEEPLHIRHDVVVRRRHLHRPRLTLHVHQAEITARVRDDAGELRLAAECGDVVDKLRAEVERAARSEERRVGKEWGCRRAAY